MSLVEVSKRILKIRIFLFLPFLAYSAVILGAVVNRTNGTAGVGIGIFLLSVSMITGLLSMITMNGSFAYPTFLTVVGAELLINMPLLVFTTHIGLTLVFSESITSVKPYHLINRQIKVGPHENVGSNLHACVLRVRRTLFIVGCSVVLTCLAYGILPELLPLEMGFSSLAIYAMIMLVAIAVLALYLND